MLVERKKQEVAERCTCVVVSLYTCISALALFVRASEGMRMCVSVLPYFGNMSGKGRE